MSPEQGQAQGGGAQQPAQTQAQIPGIAEAQMFAQGVELGTEWVRKASVQVKAWAEEHPGQAVLVALGAGFLLGRLFLGGSRKRTLDLDLDEE